MGKGSNHAVEVGGCRASRLQLQRRSWGLIGARVESSGKPAAPPAFPAFTPLLSSGSVVAMVAQRTSMQCLSSLPTCCSRAGSTPRRRVVKFRVAVLVRRAAQRGFRNRLTQSRSGTRCWRRMPRRSRFPERRETSASVGEPPKAGPYSVTG